MGYYDAENNYIEDSATLLAQQKAAQDAADQAAYNKSIAGTYTPNGVYHPLAMDGSADAAANATAAVLRGNYANWKEQFFPRIGELMNMTSYNNPGLVEQETAKSVQQVNSAFDSTQNSAVRKAASFGMTPQLQPERVNNLARMTSTVDAINTTRQTIKDRDRSIAAGGLPAAVSQ